MATRAYLPLDAEDAAAVLGDQRPLASARVHAQVAEGGAREGLALWWEPGSGEEAGYLGPVLLPPGTPRRLFYELALACAREALERGVERGRFVIKDAALLARLQRDFSIDPQPAGREPNTGQPVAWEIRVDVRDAIRQLESALA